MEKAKQEELESIIQLRNFHQNDMYDWYVGEYDQFVVEYQWTNTANYAKSPFWDITIDVYQDGVELERDYSYDEPYNALTNIASGDTITNSIAFRLNNSYSDVEVIVKRYLADLSSDLSEISYVVSLDSGNSSTGQYAGESMPEQSGSDTSIYEDYNLYFYEGVYFDYEDIADVHLTVEPSGTEFFCVLLWADVDVMEDGIIRPGIPARLSGGTTITVDLDTNGDIEVALEQDGSDSFLYSLTMTKYE